MVNPVTNLYMAPMSAPPDPIDYDLLELALLFWGTFVKAANYPIADNVGKKAIKFTLIHMKINKDVFGEKEKVEQARQCIRITAHWARKIARRRGHDRIKRKDYNKAYKIVAGYIKDPTSIKRLLGATLTANAAGPGPAVANRRAMPQGLLCDDQSP